MLYIFLEWFQWKNVEIKSTLFCNSKWLGKIKLSCTFKIKEVLGQSSLPSKENCAH